MNQFQEQLSKAQAELNSLVVGQEKVIKLMYAALLADGHILLESVPGTGKTVLAKYFAAAISGQFKRVQFTPDVLPSDVTGIQYFNPQTRAFELRAGPVQTNVLLADEINRATPKTQSSLLEAMAEKQATIDGETVNLPNPFLVIATQNPIESNQGTFALPEAQLDRFLFKIALDYPPYEEEKQLLLTVSDQLNQTISSYFTTEDIQIMQQQVKQIHIAETLADYLLRIVRATRNHGDISIGVSTRGAIAALRAAQAHAYIDDRSFVSPEDVRNIIPFVMEHRIVLSMEGAFTRSPSEIINEIVEQITIPVELEEGRA